MTVYAGRRLIRDREKLAELAQFNLTCALRAKAATSYHLALKYLRQGLLALATSFDVKHGRAQPLSPPRTQPQKPPVSLHRASTVSTSPDPHVSPRAYGDSSEDNTPTDVGGQSGQSGLTGSASNPMSLRINPSAPLDSKSAESPPATAQPAGAAASGSGSASASGLTSGPSTGSPEDPQSQNPSSGGRERLGAKAAFAQANVRMKLQAHPEPTTADVVNDERIRTMVTAPENTDTVEYRLLFALLKAVLRCEVRIQRV